MSLFLNVFITIMVLGFATFTSATPIERHVLALSANNGGKDRPILRYAETDAKSFVAVLSEMGGVQKNNAILLHEPSIKSLKQQFDQLDRKILQSKKNGARQELLVYYSGHADDQGLHLGNEIYPWSDLRKRIDAMNASVKITVIDACGSGAITRMKGGVAVPAFMVDASSDMNGYAFITSSTQNEASQESDRLQGSFFTHSLVSGLRGAGDASGDGKVTLSEAYQFAFNETLQKTQTTMGGAQHPSRDMNLTGTGDVVMTDIRNTSAGLILDEKMEGRLFIRDEQNRLVAELQKLRGRSLELGLPAGVYKVQMMIPEQNLICDVHLKEGSKEQLSNQKFSQIKLTKTVSRGESTADSTKKVRRRHVTFNFIDLEDQPRKGTQFGVIITSAEDEMVGSQFSLLLNKSRKEFSGIQLSAVGNLAQKMDGIQISTVFNIARNLDGIQLSSGLNQLKEKSNGVQIGSINLTSDTLKGIQIGTINGANTVNNQIGSINWAKTSNLQIASINHANNVDVQIGSVNSAKSISKVQLGVVNLVQKNNGRSIGVINICSNCKKAPIGLINIVGNGVWSFSSTVDESANFIGNIRLGTAAFYTIFETSRSFNYDEGKFDKGMTSGLGFGTQFGRYATHFDLDFMTLLDYRKWTPSRIGSFNMDMDEEFNLHYRARLGATYRVTKGFGLMGGINANVVTEGSLSQVYAQPRGKYHAEWHIAGRDVRVWPGLYAGLLFGKF